MKTKALFSSLLALGVIAALTPAALAHNGMKKAPSPQASVTQYLGAAAKVTIEYHRPAVKERAVWGEMIKYGALWSPGANQNTTIEFDKDVLVNGEAIPAGKYGFHTLPSEGDWVLIFSKNSDLFRSMKYNEEEDALRITATPEKAAHMERLQFDFEDLTINGATAYLHWEELKVKFTIEVPMDHE